MNGLVGRCGAAWERLRQVDRASRWAQEQWREPFQLVTGALVYLTNVLGGLDGEDLHRLLKPQAEENVAAIFAGCDLPEFGAGKALRSDFALMHLASATMRLPAAVWLLGKKSSGSAAGGVAGSADLVRGNLLTHLEAALALGCCRSGWAGADRFKVSVALVLAHRDEFMHGEAGEPDEGWRELRPKVMAAAFRCRLVESQLTVIEWAVGALA